MTRQFLQAVRIGNYVQHSLAEVQFGKVIGATSKGVFFLFGHNSLFLTRAQGLSPFNIVIPEANQIPEGLNTGDEAFYSVGDLLVPSRQLTIALSEAEIWTPPEPFKTNASIEQQKSYMEMLVSEIKQIAQDKGFLFW
jgi:hypothetical protein